MERKSEDGEAWREEDEEQQREEPIQQDAVQMDQGMAELQQHEPMMSGANGVGSEQQSNYHQQPVPATADSQQQPGPSALVEMPQPASDKPKISKRKENMMN